MSAEQRQHEALRGYDPALLELIQDRIRRMVDDGMTDEQIEGALLFDWNTLGEHQQISRYLRALRLRAKPPVTELSDYQREKIALVLRVHADRKRHGLRPSRKRDAELAGIDRGTLSAWIEKGLLTLD